MDPPWRSRLQLGQPQELEQQPLEWWYLRVWSRPWPLPGCSSLASEEATCSLAAADSSQPAPKTSVLRIPSLSNLSLTQLDGHTAPAVKLFELPRKSRPQIRIAQNDGPCFTMRSSKFTARDLESAAPKPSSYSTCTPVAGSHLKNAEAVPVK